MPRELKTAVELQQLVQLAIDANFSGDDVAKIIAETPTWRAKPNEWGVNWDINFSNCQSVLQAAKLGEIAGRLMAKYNLKK
jgi:hypothetical protein